MMIGHDDVDAEFAGPFDGGGRRYAVVDRQNQTGLRIALGHQIDHRGRKAVAVGDAVGNEIVGADAHHGQTAQGDRAGRGAVAVVVGHDGDELAAFPGERQTFGGGPGAFKREGRQHRAPVLGEFGGVADAAGGKRAGHRREVALHGQRLGGAKIVCAVHNSGHCASVAS